MRFVAVALALLLLVLAALWAVDDAGLTPAALAPYLAPYQDLARAAAPKAIAALALLSFLALLFYRPARMQSPAPAAAEAAKPSPLPTTPTGKQADAEVVGFLALLQDKGRLVDFLMDDIAAYSDAEVGAAARVLHEGCKAVLTTHFSIKPVRAENEGAKVTVPAGYAADEYRLVGRLSGEPPFTGALVHHGWKTEWVKLPRLVGKSAERLPAIAPAEVELA